MRNKAVYIAPGMLPDGNRDILGLWIENTEGAKFWMKVFNDLKTRGVNDILIAVTDGLKGMAEALGAVFAVTTLQTCIVHLIRNSLDLASWKDRRALAAALRPDLHGAQRRSGRGRAECLRTRPLGSEDPHGGGRLAPRLGQGDSVLQLPAGGAQGELHHQRHRKHQREAAQDHQDPRSLPQ